MRRVLIVLATHIARIWRDGQGSTCGRAPRAGGTQPGRGRDTWASTRIARIAAIASRQQPKKADGIARYFATLQIPSSSVRPVGPGHVRRRRAPYATVVSRVQLGVIAGA